MTASFALMVDMPLSDSLNMAKIGDRASPSNRFSSRDVVTNILRTRKKYHINGGTKTSVTGRTDMAETSAPRTRNAITRKSNSVVGSWSSLLPTSEKIIKVRVNMITNKS